MKISTVSIILLIIGAAFFVTGCKKTQAPAEAPKVTETAKTNVTQCAYPYDVQIIFAGPGGHSNGAYGRTNALHAAGRTIEIITMATPPEGSIININSISGGNSVNSIAADAVLTIESCNATEASAAATAKLIDDSLKTGINAENAFRNVKTAETNADGVLVDIRAEVKKLL